jgi:hypothetical protein
MLSGMPASPSQVLSMQRVAGNRATVQRMPELRAGLPQQMRVDAERESGFDLGSVRVHRDSCEPATQGAKAFARGDEIHLGQGRESSLGHELWHVVQQRQGRVGSTASSDRGLLDNSPDLEREAERIGSRLLRGGPTDSPRGVAAAGAVVQHDGWKLAALHAKIESDNLPGVCNALSTAQLLGLIKPGAEDKTTGVGADNWTHVKALKKILDSIANARVLQSDSGAVTMQFLQYFDEKLKDKGDTWMDSLNDDSVSGEVRKFQQFVIDRGLGTGLPKGSKVSDAYRKGAETLNEQSDTNSDEWMYDKWTSDELGKVVGDPLDEVMKACGGFRGVISIKADVSEAPDGPEKYANHQFSVTYERSASKLSVFDQNTGLAVSEAKDQETIQKALAAHLTKYYIDQPMRAGAGMTDGAQIIVRLMKTEEAVTEEVEAETEDDTAAQQATDGAGRLSATSAAAS